MRKYLVLLLIIAGALTIAGCGKKYEALDTDVEGEISVMLWSGDGQFYQDIGKQDLAPEDLTGQNQATVYAVAKAFNETYPNVKINVYAKQNGPNDNDVSWDQERENFKTNYGHYPSVYASTDLAGDVTKGLVADLSVFADDPMYKSFNESIMAMMNYYGVQAGLPQFLQPWGVYINKELADQNNIDIPDPDWTIEEYTDFVESADMTNFWGAMDTPFSFLFTGTTTLAQQLANYPGTGPHINLNSNEVKALIPYISRWADSSIWGLNDQGQIPSQVMDDNWWWAHKFFIENKILTNDGDPWMMGDAANPTEGHWAGAKSNDWDIYPRPSTPYQPNTVGVVLDPLAVYNFGMEDGNPEYTEEESLKLKIAYTFASFWVGDDAAWEARAEQEFLDGEALKSAMNDSLPFVTGEAFERQMEIWYSVDIHARFKDAAKMPGWQKVLEIWEAGQVWDVSDKAYLWTYDNAGTRENILYEWQNIYNPVVVTGDPAATSPMRHEAGWTPAVLAKLAQWNSAINSRFIEAETELREGLMEFYGFTEEDFS
jgi:ABC-type glycerol-3-phosphate transport system substrate-binding protein